MSEERIPDKYLAWEDTHSPLPPPLSPVVEMLSDLLVLSAPLSLPSLYLAYLLHKKDYLGTVFNQQTALLLLLSGLITPASMSMAVFRLSAEEFLMFPDLELEYLALAPHLCSLLSYLSKTWLAVIKIFSLTSVIFR